MRKRFLSLFLILTLLCPQIVIFAENSDSALPENDFTIIEEGVPYELDTSEEELPEYEPIIHTEELTGLPDDFLEGDYEDWPSFGESEISTYADITETNNYYVSWSKVFGDAYGSSFFSPTLQRKDGARIEGNTNRLIIEETDLHLPGKNGLDVVIKRRHDNQHFDDIYNLYRDTDSGIYIHAFYSFDFLDTDSGNIHRIVFPTVDDFYCYMSNGIDISEYPSKKQEGTCSGSDVSFYPATQIYNKRCEPSDTSIHLEPISTDYSIVKVRVLSRYSLDYRTSLNDIDMVGNGWSLLFPQARIYGYNYIKNERSNTTTVYQYDYISSFQDIYGGIHTFSGYDTFTRVTIGETATYQYTSSFYPEDNNYLTMERFFGMQTIPGTELEYNFAVYDNSGLTYYLITPTFSTTAKPSRTQKLYPVAVSDSYGNLIQYILDSSNKVTKIIDTYGKEINISSSGISYYDETKQAEQTIQYQTETLPAETLNNNSPIKGKEIIRLTVINPAGEETIYDSRQTELLISCDFVSASSGSLNDFLYPTGHPVYQHSSYNIERIIHPSGAESHYQYKRIYPKGDSSSVRHGVYAVEDAYTLSGNQRIAHQSYTLTNTSENITITGTNQGTGAITIQKYNADGLCTSQVTSPTGTTTQKPYSNIRTTYDSKFNPTSIIYSDSGLSKTTTASYQSLYPATISSTNDGKQFVKYTYHTRDDRLTGIPRVTTYQSGKNGEYSIETTLNDKLSVEYARVIQNNMLKAQTKYEYDNSGRVIKELQWIGDTNNDGVLDENDETTCLLHSYADENGTHTVTNTVTGLKDADGNTLPDVSATYIYDMHGNPIEQIDPNGNHSTISYDAVHRPLEITLPNGAKRTYSYDITNLTTTATDEAGKQIKIQYDAVGNILGKYQKNNENWDTLEAYTYDAALRPLSVKIYQDSNLFLSEQYSYDVLDRLIQKQVLDEADSLQYTENYTYTLSSTNGTRKKVTTAQDGTVTAIATDTFNAYDEILSQAFSSGTVTHTTSATYDYAGRPLTQTDPLGNITTYTYDYAGNVLTVTDELSNVQAFSYDMTGRKKSQTDAKGNTTTYTYDALDRLIQTDFPFADGITSKQKSYYDAASNLILAKNQNNAVNDAESYTSVAYSYDNMNRL
ncbi:MAG: RHS repeat protein, partial [Ruminococcaceae bacterium]|nr:RHS repeat protein [Oscillospiraceae bacterium]